MQNLAEPFGSSIKIPAKEGGGVYGIVNLSNGRIYIGSTGSLCKRKRTHRFDLIRGECRSKAMLQDFKKGHRFDFFTIETAADKEDRLDREQFWITFYRASNSSTGYNTCPNSRTSIGVKRNDETLKKLSESHIGKPQPWLRKRVHQLDLDGIFIREFPSITEASRFCGFKRPNGNIVSAASGNQKTAYGYKWRYA